MCIRDRRSPEVRTSEQRDREFWGHPAVSNATRDSKPRRANRERSTQNSGAGAESFRGSL
eukprot:6042256-Alexandrium_andersonii.AAC.1